MAGYVKADRYRVPGVTVLQLHSRECPATHKYAEVCMQYDPHSGAACWCPFMYGLNVRSGGWHLATARTPRDAAAIMAAADDAPDEDYTILCLRQTSALMTIGALRP
jgi:hypothetical protein